jgi:hypothetical protein
VSDIAFWDDEQRPILMLITPEWLEKLPNGVVLHSITGKRAVVGRDYIDGDTRGGFLAFGFYLDHERLPTGEYI